ncbi:MAG TPA: hypothetical protein DEA46_00595 [Candidatus Moranbacteria bacterium]|nr:hypothetical protein [Candidatus Moranbacteria bacterium]
MINHFSSTGDLQIGVRTGELWDQVREAQEIDWDLKRSLHDLAYKASMGNLHIDDAIREFNSLIKKYNV